MHNYTDCHRFHISKNLTQSSIKPKAALGFEPMTASLLIQRVVYIEGKKRYKLKNYNILILQKFFTTPMFIALTLELRINPKAQSNNLGREGLKPHINSQHGLARHHLFGIAIPMPRQPQFPDIHTESAAASTAD